MDPEKTPTRASEVVLPIELVTLSRLKARGGISVVVGCESVDELVLARILQSWPGERPPSAMATKPTPDEVLARIDLIAPQLIEAATFLEGDDGEEVRPAFWFTTRVKGAIPGRLLREEDKILLVQAIMRAGGYMDAADGGAAESGAFPGGDRARAPDEPGAVAVLPHGGADTLAGVEGPAPGVQPDGDARGGEAGADRD